jgi:hypothetical protein
VGNNKNKEPIGKFIINNAKGTETQNGVYYHYSEVCALLKKHKEQLILSGVSHQRELLIAELNKTDLEYIHKQGCTDILAEDLLRAINCG